MKLWFEHVGPNIALGRAPPKLRRQYVLLTWRMDGRRDAPEIFDLPWEAISHGRDLRDRVLANLENPRDAVVRMECVREFVDDRRPRVTPLWWL